MQSKSSALQDQINELDQLIQNGVMEDGSRASDNQFNMWEMTRADKKKEHAEALAEEAQQQATTEMVGYILDTMTVEGLTIAEIITNDDEYKLVRKGVQDAFIYQAEVHQEEWKDIKSEFAREMKALGDRAIEAEQANEQLRKDNNDLEVKNYELNLENEELSEKVRKVAELQHEANQQIEQQKSHIDELQKQLALGIRGALNVVDVPQDTSKIAAEIIAKKVRITNARFKDENGIDRRIKRAETVLTGETVEYEAIYEKRYIILNAEQAEQYRADEANKKAELEAQQAAIPTLEVPEIQPVNAVLEEEAPAEENSFPSDQVQTTDNGEVQGDQGNESLHEVVSEESQMKDGTTAITFTISHQESMIRMQQAIKSMENRVSSLELGQQAVA